MRGGFIRLKSPRFIIYLKKTNLFLFIYKSDSLSIYSQKHTINHLIYPDLPIRVLL